MKLERIAPNQIKYIISFDELTYKGFFEEEMVTESFIWDALFDEMLDEASRMFQLESTGAVSIEIYSLTAKELVLILTIDEDEVDELFNQDQIIYSDFSDELNVIVTFEDIDDCISLAGMLCNLNCNEFTSNLYTFNDKYYLQIEKTSFQADSLLAISEEFGEISTYSTAFLEDYGKILIHNSAVKTLNHHFKT